MPKCYRGTSTESLWVLLIVKLIVVWIGLPRGLGIGWVLTCGCSNPYPLCRFYFPVIFSLVHHDVLILEPTHQFSLIIQSKENETLENLNSHLQSKYLTLRFIFLLDHESLKNSHSKYHSTRNFHFFDLQFHQTLVQGCLTTPNWRTCLNTPSIWKQIL